MVYDYLAIPDEKHSDESLSRNTKGVRGAVHARVLRRSKYIIDRSCKTYARKDKEEEKEEVLNSSYQFISTTLQPSST
ncbi:hypothetical protein C1645_838978 [Glomus cerebriforme]|uniref:Uncharacterized protein n=1 Tax=Glomus cerebriforme TaxID=658196 RepID=A0A397S1E6_9GLOM|nr:hypothetical protein C1645_838978 [Glomus cerebriforme]